MYGIVYAKGAEFCQSAKNKPCTFVWLSTRSDLIYTRFQRVIYVSNERKLIFDQISDLLFLSSGYISGVMIELIY